MRPEMGLRLLRLLHRHRSLPQSSSASRFTAGPLYRLSWGLSWSAAGQRQVLAVDAIIGTVVVRLFRAYRMAHNGVAAHALVAPFKLPSDFLGRARQRLCGRWTHDGSEDRERAYKFQHWNDVRPSRSLRRGSCRSGSELCGGVPSSDIRTHTRV
jgi:hypothetical protein